MDIGSILSKVDHTLLRPDSTWEQVAAVCDDAVAYKTASVCIPPSFVRRAKERVGGQTRVCTVVGFPSGSCTTAVKVFETREAVENGADEIDMVIHIGALKDGDTAYVAEEIRAVRRACPDSVLKVIIETCLLTDEEKKTMCRIVTEAGADFIKTSTGFSTGGATQEDAALLLAHVGPGVRVKASGGISGLEDARQYIRLGCARLGTSRVVAQVKAGGEG